ncbi:Ssl1 domain protein [Solidesulfovibrio fructosivorans JJ]]|uniref:Ssl1 domain protein n=1 Tax=Solidesulfovibrio fructosivorans JJ] TaxID=596151 RepID=E1JTI6_SOLFR|nr:VWA domain-containing protein [Solidesulfovibrio fructosivorans]EFL52446.1 Ssl1 domain protein [Solidesulfovibrio fructosivorans JJ]]
MTFARPEFLALLVAVPVCASFLWLAGARRRGLAAFFPSVSGHGRLRRVKAILFLAGLALLALGAAGPRAGHVAAVVAPPPALRLLVAVDCSRSMLARDMAPDRLSAAKGLVRAVLAGLPHVAAGVVGFSGRAWLACPVTADRPALALFLDALSPAEAPLGGTSVTAALEACRLALTGARSGAILVLSDGEDTVPVRDATGSRPDDPPVFTVAVGGATPVAVPLPPEAGGGVLRDGEGRPVLVGVDAAGLAGLAQDTGGRFFRLAPDAPSPASGIVAALAAQAAAKGHAAATVDAPADRSALCYAAGLALLVLDLLLVPLGKGGGAAVLAVAVLGATALPARAGDPAAKDVSRGIAAFAADDAATALEAFLAARVWRPDSPEILYDIGTAYYRLGRFDEAGRMFARAASAGSPALQARALYNQGNAACRQGDAEGAGRLYAASLAVDPSDAEAKANLEWLRSGADPCRKGGQDAGEPGSKPGRTQDAAAGGEGKADAPGKAPAPVGQDDGSGKREGPDGPAASADAPPSAEKEGPANAPVSGASGQKAGEKRARSAGKLGDPVLDRVPDLTGLPTPPLYGRPSVAKDW